MAVTEPGFKNLWEGGWAKESQETEKQREVCGSLQAKKELMQKTKRLVCGFVLHNISFWVGLLTNFKESPLYIADQVYAKYHNVAGSGIVWYFFRNYKPFLLIVWCIDDPLPGVSRNYCRMKCQVNYQCKYKYLVINGQAQECYLADRMDILSCNSEWL